MRAWQARSLVLAVAIASALLCAGAQVPSPPAKPKPAPAKPKPGPPPGVPTEFGRLVRVERQPSTTIRVFEWKPPPVSGGTEGVVTSDGIKKAAEGKEFLILHFEGRAELAVESGTEAADHLAGLVAKTFGQPGSGMVRQDGRSTLMDGAGNKLNTAYIVSTPLQRQLAFEIPQGASGLIWSDGKASFRLEPKILRIEEPQTPPAQ